MTNPWKLATVGLAITGVTALSTGLTTAWMLRPTTPAVAEAPAAVMAARPVARAATPAAPVVRATVPPRVTQESEMPNSSIRSPTPATRNLRAHGPNVSSTGRTGQFAQVSALGVLAQDIRDRCLKTSATHCLGSSATEWVDCDGRACRKPAWSSPRC